MVASMDGKVGLDAQPSAVAAEKGLLIRLQRLLRVTEQVLAETTVMGLLQKVVCAASEVIGAQVGIVEYGYRTEQIALGVVCYGGDPPVVLTGHLLQPETRAVFLQLVQESPSLLLSSDELNSHPLKATLPLNHFQLNGLLGARLVDSEGAINGLIVMSHSTPVNFTPEDETLLLQLAGLTALGLRHIQAREDAERRAAEAERSRAMLEGLMEYVPQGITIVDAETWKVEYISRYSEIFTGYSLEHLKMKSWPLFRPADQTPALWEERPLTRLLRTGELVKNEEWLLQRADGSFFPLVCDAVQLRDRQDKVTAAIVVWRDIESFKAALQERENLLSRIQEEQRQSAALAAQAQSQADRLRATFSALTDIVLIFNQEGKIVEVNPAAVKAYGFDPTGLDRKACVTCVGLRRDLHGDNIPINEFFSLENMDGTLSLNERAIYTDAQGRDVVVSISTAPVYDRGKVTGMVGVWRDVTEREALLTQLNAEQARIKALIDAAPEGIVMADPGGRIVFSNPMGEYLLGRPIPYHQPLVSYMDLQLCYPDGRPYEPEDLPWVRAALVGEAVNGLEITIPGPNEQARNLLCNAAPIRDEYGMRKGAVITFQDITDRKLVQNALQESVVLLQMLHELDQAILTGVPIESIFQTALRDIHLLLARNYLELSAFEFNGEGAVTLATYPEMGVEPRVGWHCAERELWFLPGLRRGEIVANRIDGSVLESILGERLREAGILTYLNVPLQAQGTLIGSLNLGAPNNFQLTERQSALLQEFVAQLSLGLWQARLSEKVERYTQELERLVTEQTTALRSSEARFRSVFEAAALGIVLTDMEGRILTSNPAFQRFIGHSAEELHGMGLPTFAHPDDWSHEPTWSMDSGPEPQVHYVGERRYRCSDGKFRWVNITISLVRSSVVMQPFFLYLVEDVTERRQIQSALLQAEKLAVAGKMAAALAHEINNPLQTVIGCLGLAEETLADGGSIERYLQVAGDELMRAARIVSQLRELNRPPASVDKSAVDLNGLLERVMLLIRKVCLEQKIEVIWRPKTGLPMVHGGPDQLHQVFLNLALNAVESMPHGGRLEFRVEQTPAIGMLRVMVKDSGRGMAEEILPHIFSPFFTTKQDGMGLGLYVTSNIVKEHGGQIEVESRSGEGTCFQVTLPYLPGKGRRKT